MQRTEILIGGPIRPRCAVPLYGTAGLYYRYLDRLCSRIPGLHVKSFGQASVNLARFLASRGGVLPFIKAMFSVSNHSLHPPR